MYIFLSPGSLLSLLFRKQSANFFRHLLTAKRILQQSNMSDLDLSPPEVPEPTFLESVLRYGLFLGAIFQLICILAVIIPTSKGHDQEETETTDSKATAEQMKKSKGPLPQIRQKPKKESKKKR